jgi:hypothetical protein
MPVAVTIFTRCGNLQSSSLVLVRSCALLYLIAVLIADTVVAHISPATEAQPFSSFATNLPRASVLEPNLQVRKAMAERLLTILLRHADLDRLPAHLIFWDRPGTNALVVSPFRAFYPPRHRSRLVPA